MLLGSVFLALACQPPASDSGDLPAPSTEKTLWSDSASLGERVKIILALHDGVERARRFATLLESNGPDRANEIADLLETSPRDTGDVDLALFAEWWTRFDPDAAFQWAESTWRSKHPRVISTVVRTWARQDPEAAYAYGFHNRRLGGAPFFRDELIDAVIVGWIESGDEARALAFALQLKDLTTMQRAIRAVGRMRVATAGVTEALAWARDIALEDESQQRYLMLNVVSAAADQDPRQAAEFMSSLRDRGEDYPGIHPRIGARWARYDARAAMEWAQQLGEGKDRDDAVDAIASAWFVGAPDEARAFIESQGVQRWLEPAISQYIRNEIRRARPDTEWQAILESWTLPLTMDIYREAMTALVVQRWVAHDEAACTAWLDAHPEALSPRQREKATTLTEKTRTSILRQSARNEEAEETS